MFLFLFIFFRLLWFGSPFWRLMKGYGSTSLWNLTFVGGIGPVTCQGLRLLRICVCALPSGSGSLLSGVQWIFQDCALGCVLIWHGFSQSLLLYSLSCFCFAEEQVWSLLYWTCCLKRGACFPCRHGNSGVCASPLMFPEVKGSMLI